VSRHKLKPIALREGRNDELRFDQREVVADALTWACTEGDVHKLRAIGAPFR
jgi:hypothetical protein